MRGAQNRHPRLSYLEYQLTQDNSKAANSSHELTRGSLVNQFGFEAYF